MSAIPRPFPVFHTPQEASRWLHDFCWDGSVPVNVAKICKRLGIGCVLHEFSDPETIVESGFVNGKPTIRLSKACYEAGGTRPSFALAHALGHVMLHWDQLKELDRPAANLSPV